LLTSPSNSGTTSLSKPGNVAAVSMAATFSIWLKFVNDSNADAAEIVH
jgi:hypothetical protein